jgi:hypothetical protein
MFPDNPEYIQNLNNPPTDLSASPGNHIPYPILFSQYVEIKPNSKSFVIRRGIDPGYLEKQEHDAQYKTRDNVCFGRLGTDGSVVTYGESGMRYNYPDNPDPKIINRDG